MGASELKMSQKVEKVHDFLKYELKTLDIA